ncbi:MAG: tetrathionate reductase family octaheme c-type cytochrome [Deltaproteobacteria bacterium]|nr:tetrathionate reductase family octaheme c-type cytochrome [Deltaproteobacteria bacterium]
MISSKPLAAGTGVLIALMGALIGGSALGGDDNPRAHLPAHAPKTDHAALIQGALENGEDVTRMCLECHPNASKEMMATDHFTWGGQPVQVPGSDEVVHIGKRNALNNFCIGVQPNMGMCVKCHVGQGWTDEAHWEPTEASVDCLVCHADTKTYWKTIGGWPAADVDLVAAAKSVGPTNRDNCGQCHATGGGGDGVKHGDLDNTLRNPNARIDAHMGKHGMLCTDCHQTAHHQIPGMNNGTSMAQSSHVQCEDCHDPRPHRDDRLNNHTATVACETCHIPHMAVDTPTKMSWDWSTAGRDDIPEDHYTYMKIKGSFVYETMAVPQYKWYNGTNGRHLAGDIIDPSGGPVQMNPLCGNIADPQARIWPVKVHRSNQPYDTVHNYLLIPKTWGEGGFWTEFDWQKALTLGELTSGLAYSGHYDFTWTEMDWPLAHMVQTEEKALQCTDCHAEGGRMDWEALGYDGDPAILGGRLQNDLVAHPEQLREALEGSAPKYKTYDDGPVPTVCEEVTR